MKVVLFPADEGACGAYRMRYPAAAAAAAGYDVSVSEQPIVSDAIVEKKNDRPVRIGRAVIPECDIAVFQRPGSPEAIPIFDYYKRQGVRVVIELDDNFHQLRPNNPSWWSYRHPESNDLANLDGCLKLADRIMVSTPDLAREYGTDVIVENCVPESYFGITNDGFDKTMGWCGSLHVHRDDLRVVGAGVAEALRAEPGWGFAVIGEGAGVARELNLDLDPPDTGWVPMDQYLGGMSQLTLGIAPLADHTFNQGKSWIKALEMAALGVPFVASDLPEYRRLGAGEIVPSRSRRWRGALLHLMRNPHARIEQMGHNMAIARDWTYERNVERWWEAWTG